MLLGMLLPMTAKARADGIDLMAYDPLVLFQLEGRNR
jgi:hypothetical protein